ncbi:indole-3-acetic acid-induced protein ARG7-like [Pyrus ussuriensis x Pyrus communis]|uniref:Indole-3-acetic acid-induced protein ARG7-like n=1 Tax=Pyrus ussuriensis x Pyrus communis TaxID=2448454 RepID=A0A5N5I5T2_9ROSA|nr:indole-3-acetic acid-induced protein ARG7-like [Pyrus ussuriensis x Pyrus communis]
MSPAISKCNKLRRIVRIRQMLQRWHKKARLTAAPAPSDVPSGHVAICVGSSCKRFVVRATYLNHPIFQKLLVQAEEEYGFANQGPLAIPCDESFFEEVLRVLARSESGNSGRFLSIEDLQRRCHVDALNQLEYLSESRPLLRGLADKSVYMVKKWVR